MILFPAIDLYEGKAVRLFKGRYDDMTIYSEDPGSIGEDFKACGASHIHIVARRRISTRSAISKIAAAASVRSEAVSGAWMW